MTTPEQSEVQAPQMRSPERPLPASVQQVLEGVEGAVDSVLAQTPELVTVQAPSELQEERTAEPEVISAGQNAPRREKVIAGSVASSLGAKQFRNDPTAFLEEQTHAVMEQFGAHSTTSAKVMAPYWASNPILAA